MDVIPWLCGGAGHTTPAEVSVAGRSLDADGLAGAAAAVARRVQGMAVAAVEATPSLETVVAVCGCLMAGVPLVPLPPDAGPGERGHILRDCAAEAVIGDGVPVDVTERADFRPVPATGESVALVVYTSGTTGPPKGVMLTAGAIAADIDMLADAWEWTGGDVLVHGLPLFHVHGLVLGVLGPLRTGSRLVHTGRPAPSAYAAAAGVGGSLYFGVPTVWSRVAADPSAASALRAARLLVSGSAGLPVAVFDALSSLAGQGPVERYGMTETLITVSARAAGPRRPGWVGQALPGVSTRLVDDSGSPVPPDGDAVGDLEVCTPTLMSGYLNRPEDTAALATPDGWTRTGDVACVDRDGCHRIVGRKTTDLIKTGGFRVGAGEVEAALLAHPGVEEAAVVGHPDDDLGEAIVAFVVGAGVAPGELADHVARTLSVHKRPRRVVLVDSLPRNAMGKVQKRLLLPGAS